MSSAGSPPTAVNPGDSRGRPRGHPVSWQMLVISTFAILVTSFDRAILPTVLPEISEEFDLSPTEAGDLLFWAGVGTVVGAFVLGAFGDSFGKGPRRAWLWVGTVMIAVVAGIATVFNNTVGQLKVWRFVMGVGTGGMEPVNVALISDWWQKENRGFAVGVHHTGFPIGQFVGPLLIGIVVATAGWRGSFLLIPLFGIPIMIAQVVVGRRRNIKRVNEWIRQNGLTPSIDEDEPARFESPVASTREAASNRNVVLGVITAFLLIFCEFGVANFLTTQLTEDFGLELGTGEGFLLSAAVISGASGLTGWIGQVGWSTLSDRTGRKFSLSIIAVGWAVTLALLVFISGPLSAWLLLLAWGLFRNSPFPVIYSLLIDSIPNAASAGMGIMIAIAVGMSQVFSGPFSGRIIQSYSYDVNYLILAGIALLTLIPVRLMRETVATSEETAGVAA